MGASSRLGFFLTFLSLSMRSFLSPSYLPLTILLVVCFSLASSMRIDAPVNTTSPCRLQFTPCSFFSYPNFFFPLHPFPQAFGITSCSQIIPRVFFCFFFFFFVELRYYNPKRVVHLDWCVCLFFLTPLEESYPTPPSQLSNSVIKFESLSFLLLIV